MQLILFQKVAVSRSPLWSNSRKRFLTLRILGSRLMGGGGGYLTPNRIRFKEYAMSWLYSLKSLIKMSTFFQTFQMQSNGFPVPTVVTGNTSARMNQIIRPYLQALVSNNLLVSFYS